MQKAFDWTVCALINNNQRFLFILLYECLRFLDERGKDFVPLQFHAEDFEVFKAFEVQVNLAGLSVYESKRSNCDVFLLINDFACHRMSNAASENKY